MKIYEGSLVVGGYQVIDGKFVKLAEVKELLASAETIQRAHRKLLREIKKTREVMQNLTGHKESKLPSGEGRG